MERKNQKSERITRMWMVIEGADTGWTSAQPVNHCSQSTVNHSEKHVEHADGKTASQAEQLHNVNSAGHIVTDSRKKRGARHCCFCQCRSDERCPEKYKGIAFSLFPKPKQRLEDCKAWIRACGRPHDQGSVSWRLTTVK